MGESERNSLADKTDQENKETSSLSTKSELIASGLKEAFEKLKKCE